MAPPSVGNAKIFVSYARTDKEFVLRLVSDLRKVKANVWMDASDIRVGDDWTRSIQNALEACELLIVVLSPASVGSDNVLAELNFALDNSKRVIPALYVECKRPFRINTAQYADFTTEYPRGLRSLLDALAEANGIDRSIADAEAATVLAAAADSDLSLPNSEQFWRGFLASMREKYFTSSPSVPSKIGFHDLRLLAERNDLDAMTELGLRFLNGSGGAGAKSAADAKYWLESAALGGSASAAYNLGLLYYSGAQDFTADKHKGLEWMRKADALGSVHASYLLAKNYQNGDDGFPQDHAKAFEFFQHAADGGSPEAMNELAVAYERGLGVEQDGKKAFELYQKAVDGNYAVAMDNLGVIYRDGRAGVPKDEKKAVELFARGAELDEGWCLYDLGVAYLKGMGGLRVDEIESRKRIERSAELNIPDAVYGLAMFYEGGRGGLPMDLLKALQLYQRAAALGNQLAVTRLARLAGSGSST